MYEPRMPTPTEWMGAPPDCRAYACWSSIRIAELQAEVERLKTENRMMSHTCECGADEACAHVRRAEKAEADVERLRQLIYDYGEHDINCIRRTMPDKCSCWMAEFMKEGESYSEKVNGMGCYYKTQEGE